MAPGDTLLIYTDGFAMGDQAPPESIEAALGNAHREGVDQLLDRLMALLHTPTALKVRDDVALLAARVV
jgi:serine phosphatase RsbU (regulator of sigma subunit)